MKCSSASRAERHGFPRLSSSPWHRLPARSSSPWLGFDPELQSDCSAAYRAFRLVMLALFALFGAGTRVQAESKASASGSLEARVEAQERQIAELRALVLRQAHQLESQQQLLDQLRQRPALTADAVPAQTAEEDKSESAHLVVKRTHAPPSTNNAAKQEQEEVKAGFGSIKFDGLLQGWYSGGNLTDHTFRLRRTELKFSGEVIPKIHWNIMIDPAKALAVNRTFAAVNGATVVADLSVNQASRVLQDAFITLGHVRWAQVDAGQYKLPISLEGTQSSSSLETVERALFLSDRARGGALGDVRDTGVMVRGPAGEHLDYFLGVFNGSGETQNEVDRSDHKAVAGRLVFKPGGGVQFGASGAWSAGESTLISPRRNRLGGELLWKPKRWLLKAEVMAGDDAGISRLGGYGHVGFRVTPKFEPIFRFDYFDPDTSAESSLANVIERDWIAGFNYYLREHNAKLQFNYLRKTFTAELAPSRHLFLVNLQTAW